MSLALHLQIIDLQKRNGIKFGIDVVKNAFNSTNEGVWVPDLCAITPMIHIGLGLYCIFGFICYTDCIQFRLKHDCSLFAKCCSMQGNSENDMLSSFLSRVTYTGFLETLEYVRWEMVLDVHRRINV